MHGYCIVEIIIQVTNLLLCAASKTVANNDFSSLPAFISRIGIHNHFMTCTIGWIWL